MQGRTVNKLTQPLIIDVEASGLGAGSYPIEVGVALEGGEKFCRLIEPSKSWSHWDTEAEQVHHISRENLKENGIEVVEVADALNQLLEDKVLYTDGWVVDKPWLTMLFHEARRPMLFRVSPIEIIFSEQQMAVWHETKDQVLAETNLTRHRASNDAWLVQETYRRTLAN
jgi:hypothetical protein